MNELNASKKIYKALENNVFVEVPLPNFIDMWFRGGKFTNKDLTSKLLGFSDKYKLKYLTVLSKAVSNVRVRFWKKKEIKQLEFNNE